MRRRSKRLLRILGGLKWESEGRGKGLEGFPFLRHLILGSRWGSGDIDIELHLLLVSNRSAPPGRLARDWLTNHTCCTSFIWIVFDRPKTFLF